MNTLNKLLSTMSIISITVLPGYAVTSQYTIDEAATVPRSAGMLEQTVTTAPTVAQKEIYFGLDKAALTNEDVDSLKSYAKYLIENKHISVNVEGHADERGATAYNTALGLQRATAVANKLIQLGVAKDRVAVISYGNERPAAKGHDEGAWKINRRVELKSYA